MRKQLRTKKHSFNLEVVYTNSVSISPKSASISEPTSVIIELSEMAAMENEG